MSKQQACTLKKQILVDCHVRTLSHYFSGSKILEGKCDHIWENQPDSEKINYRVRTDIVVPAQRC